MRETSDTKPKCPGENNCQDWMVAAGETQAEKEKNACFGCKLFKSKYSKSDNFIDDIVSEVESLRMKQRAGYPIFLKNLEPLIWEGLVLWHRAEFELENEHKRNIQLLCEVFLSRMPI